MAEARELAITERKKYNEIDEPSQKLLPVSRSNDEKNLIAQNSRKKDDGKRDNRGKGGHGDRSRAHDNDKFTDRDRIRDRDKGKERERDNGHTRDREKEKERNVDRDRVDNRKVSDKDKHKLREIERQKEKHREKESTKGKVLVNHNEKQRSRESEGERDKEREKERERERGREREREREKRHRESEKERNRDKQRERDRDRERERENERERERRRDREKEREKEREKDRGRRRSRSRSPRPMRPQGGEQSPKKRDRSKRAPSPPSSAVVPSNQRSPEKKKVRTWDQAPSGMSVEVAAAMQQYVAAQPITSATSAVQQAAQAATKAAQAMAAAQNPLMRAAIGLAATSGATPGAFPTPLPTSQSMDKGDALLSSTGASFVGMPGSEAAGMSVFASGLGSMINFQLSSVNTPVVSQASRPMRRLYISHVPGTVSDGELMEFINATLVSANANHIPGTKPCINCSVNGDKNYAFAEFLTVEDTKVAMGLDGISLHGQILKIRRPKDFAIILAMKEFTKTESELDKIGPVKDLVSSEVPDSPFKLFVGGIWPGLDEEKIREILTAFGQLKSFRLTLDTSQKPPKAHAFLEYLDPLVTEYACLGLNGMKIGPNHLTVCKATPEASPDASAASAPSYDIPETATRLMEKPSRIVELQNMLTSEDLAGLSEEDFHELEEEIRIECAKLGNVKSLHIVAPQDAEKLSEAPPGGRPGEGGDSPPANGAVSEAEGTENGAGREEQESSPVLEVLEAMEEGKFKLGEGTEQSEVTKHSSEVEGFRVGRVYVEFSRESSALKAAHALEGRAFNGGAVRAAFFPLKLYQMKFRKGLTAQTYEERQALALAVQDHLTSHLPD